MIDYTHLHHQHPRKLLLLTIIDVQSTFLPAILSNTDRFKSFFTGRLINKFVNIRLLKILPHLKCVATLRCDLSLITTLVWECRLFSDIDVLQGSVATCMMCGGIFNNFIPNFLEICQWTNLENWLSFYGVTAMSLVFPFYWTRCSLTDSGR